jgi:hypothetical protein
MQMDDPAAIQWARGTVRAEMAKRGLTYAKLVERLKLYGVEENERNLRNKIARGTFSAAFMVQVMEAMGANEIPIGYLQAVRIMNKEPFDRNFMKGKLGDDLAEERIAREMDGVKEIVDAGRETADDEND